MGVDQNSNIEAISAVEELGNEIYAPQKPVSRLTRWYRSPLFNVILIGLISFSQQGIWNALNSMSSQSRGVKEWGNWLEIGTGAGGEQEPYLVNGANSLTFGSVLGNKCRSSQWLFANKNSSQVDGFWVLYIQRGSKQNWY